MDGRAADALELEVVLVLAEVGELDPDAPRRNPDAREPIVELERDDLHAAERSRRLGRHRAGDGKADQREQEAPHRRIGTRA